MPPLFTHVCGAAPFAHACMLAQVLSGGVTWGWLNTSEWNRIDENTLTWEMAQALNQTEIQLMCCSEESICSNLAMRTFADGIKSCELVMVEGSKHEAFMEWDPIKEVFMSECVEFWKGKKKRGEGSVTWSPKRKVFRDLTYLHYATLIVLIWYYFISMILRAAGFM